MLIKKLTKLPLHDLLSILAIIMVGMLSIVQQNYSTVLSFVVFYSLSLFLKSMSKEIYRSCYAINCIFALLFAAGFYFDHGTLFAQGGDDRLFYEFSLQTEREGLSSFGDFLPKMNYKGMLLFYAGIISILKIVVSDVSHFSLLFFNCAIMALAMVLLHRIAQVLLTSDSFKLNTKFLLLIAMFPLTLFYSSVFLRECWITFLLIWLAEVHVMSYSAYRKYISILIILAIAFAIRPTSSFILLFFTLAYHYLNEDKRYKFAVIGFSVFALAFFVFNTKIIIKRDSIFAVREAYLNLANQQASPNSIGIVLINSTNFFMKVLTLIYVMLSPIPPLIFKGGSFQSIVLSLGSFIWYFIFSAVGIGFFKQYLKSYRKLVVPIMLTTLFASLLVMYSTLNYRHIQFIYPFFVLFFLFLYINNSNYIKSAFNIYLFLLPLGAIGYIGLKFIIL